MFTLITLCASTTGIYPASIMQAAGSQSPGPGALIKSDQALQSFLNDTERHFDNRPIAAARFHTAAEK